MKRVTVVVIAVVAMLLSACHSKEQAMTGAYGSGVVTGQVVMTEGGSPAGVTVSVAGTGMAKALGDDGQFAFGGVPDGAELVFERASDGIAASLKLTTASGHVVVDLTKTEAKKSGRRRAAGPSKTYQFEGLLTAVSDTEISMNASQAKNGVTIALTDQTVIRRGGTPLTAADLVVGMRVHVKALQTATGGYTAVQIVVQGDDDGEDDEQPAVREYEGTVLSASATQLVIYSSHKAQVTFVIDANTEIRKGNTPVLAEDIQPGWRVHVKATASADGTTNTANLVIVQRTNSGDDDDDDPPTPPTPKAKLSGSVTAVGATELTVGTTTVKTDASTVIKKRGSTITLAQVVVGDKVKVDGTRNADGSILAKSIDVKSK